VNEVIEDLKEDIGTRHIEWRIGALPDVEADAGLVKQVYANLLGNAVKYSRTREPAIIEVGAKEEDRQTVLYVRDNGVGFNMKYAHKLFGVFQRLHRPEDFEGTGIGLASTARIVQKHGGRIWAEAEPDKGATFFFTLGRQKHK
jgi:light-regulated signal transduction histidine kinase (bacteriophytochrome)